MAVRFQLVIDCANADRLARFWAAALGYELAGTPLHSDGALTIIALAVEAGVKRHLLTHRHTDLKDEFYARVRAQGHIPASEQNLREELESSKQRLAQVREENRQFKAAVEALARIVNVLTTENDQLIQHNSSRNDRNLVVLRPEIS